jgi:hypothetical protein
VRKRETRAALGSRLRRKGALVGLLAAACATGCGGSSDTYSASRFSECLQSRDASPTEEAADGSSSQQGSIRDQLASEARDQNGAVRAFTNTEAPNESSITVLFFRDTDEAEGAAQRVEDDIDAEAKRQREQGLKPAEVPPPEVRENAVILDEPTEAQSRVLDECLDESSN